MLMTWSAREYVIFLKMASKMLMNYKVMPWAHQIKCDTIWIIYPYQIYCDGQMKLSFLKKHSISAHFQSTADLSGQARGHLVIRLSPGRFNSGARRIHCFVNLPRDGGRTVFFSFGEGAGFHSRLFFFFFSVGWSVHTRRHDQWYGPRQRQSAEGT